MSDMSMTIWDMSEYLPDGPVDAAALHEDLQALMGAAFDGLAHWEDGERGLWLVVSDAEMENLREAAGQVIRAHRPAPAGRTPIDELAALEQRLAALEQALFEKATREENAAR